jgi:hypothetical protein
MFVKLLLSLILISSAYVFNLVWLPERVIQLIQLGLIGFMFLIILAQQIYGKNSLEKLNFKQPLFLILTAVFLSMIIARSYHNQGYGLTVWAQRYMYFYIVYFFLHILRPSIRDIEKIFLTLGIVYAMSYFIQYLIYPTAIFDVRQDLDRGTIRIFLPGSSFMFLALFISLQRFYMTNKPIYLALVISFFAIMVLQGTRNSLAATGLVLILSLLFSKTIRSRYLIYFLIVVSFVPVYYLLEDIFIGLVEVSEQQSQNLESNIRIKAATFFLTDFFPNTLSYIFGNGQDHMNSIYGVRVDTYKLVHGYYQSDVGFVGEFSKFGLLFAIGAIWLFIKVFATRLRPEHNYVKYYLMRSAILLPFGSGFTTSFSIVTICMLLYIADKNINKTTDQDLAEAEEESEEQEPETQGIGDHEPAALEQPQGY